MDGDTTMSAGFLFRCVCCDEVFPEDSAKYDNDLDGPVCTHCHSSLIKAAAYLRHHKIGEKNEDGTTMDSFKKNRIKDYGIQT